MNRKLLSLVAALGIILALAACTQPNESPQATNTPVPIEVEDADQDVDGDDHQDADDADTDDAHDEDGDSSDSEAMATPINAQALFVAKECADCHGENREGGFAPALLPDTLTSNAQFYIDTITNGRRQMPAWADKFTPAEIEALVNWLMTTAE